jgi:para-nitrobenzyl esterase
MIDRRKFIGLGTLAAGALVGARCRGAFAAETQGGSGTTVATNSGKVRGTVQDGVQCFKGVPYGASTTGALRFMPPAEVQPWSGVRDAVDLGLRSPQLAGSFHGQVPPEFEVMDRDEPMGEDCLVLNVWTPAVGHASKRPVMVWLHGGGYTSGSGGFICYDGKELARKHNVVVVTVNHRLSALGYLYFAGIGGEKYANASNAGMLDIVAALQWVHDNIGAFGGDPESVTIFGQSGGGGKVSTLMAMPAAQGLFQRAIVESGAAVKGVSIEAANKSATAFLAKLNLQPNQIDELQKLSVDQLLAVTAPGGPPLALAPVVDGKTLPTDPFDPTAPKLSANIPLVIGTTETEVTFFPNQILDPIDDASLRAHVKQTLRTASDAQVDQLIGAYKKGRPGASNTDIYLIMASDATFRAGVLVEADRKAIEAKAPVYQYYFRWRSPVREGKLRSFHTLEIPFVFDNVDAAKSMTGSGGDRQALADKMSAAWVAFARTGNPNNSQLPNWPPFTLADRAVMIFNDDCAVVNDPHGEEQRLLHTIQLGG